MKQIDICITSASRINELKQTFESLSHIKYDGKIRWVLHEDYFDQEESSQVVHWAKYQYFFDLIVKANPHIGLLGSIQNMLECCESDYVLRLCDDFVFTKDIDLTPIVAAMESYPDFINQVTFNKRVNNGFKGNFIKKECDFDGLTLTTSPRWSSLNSVWRVDFIRNHWEQCWESIKGTKKQFEPWKTFIQSFEKTLGFSQRDIDSDYIINNIGCYLYGGIGDKYALVNRHIGDGKSRVFSDLHNKGLF